MFLQANLLRITKMAQQCFIEACCRRYETLLQLNHHITGRISLALSNVSSSVVNEYSNYINFDNNITVSHTEYVKKPQVILRCKFVRTVMDAFEKNICSERDVRNLNNATDRDILLETLKKSMIEVIPVFEGQIIFRDKYNSSSVDEDSIPSNNLHTTTGYAMLELKLIMCNGWKKNHINESDETCPICLRKFINAETLTTPCNHQFHGKCILTALTNPSMNRSCPLCRFNFNE